MTQDFELKVVEMYFHNLGKWNKNKSEAVREFSITYTMKKEK